MLIGPTAVGKTKLSIDLAKTFGFDVISGDSMQIYKDMDILTGKVTKDEAEGVRHHMIDIHSPEISFSVSDFKNAVTEIMNTMHQNGDIPFIVGGTGHYIRSLIYDYDFNEEDQKEKRRLTELYETYDSESLYEMLKNISENAAENIHINNRKRIIRTLVKYELTGEVSTTEANYTQTPKYDTLIIGLTSEREILYQRINERVEAMFDYGLLDEVNHLTRHYQLSETASGAIGYKEFIPYFNGDASLEAVCEAIQKNSRRYAKRQLTFFRNQLDVKWFDIEADNLNEVFTTIEAFIS